jgi:uncharacterized membrane protein YhaH (DUF805 family)
MDLMFAPLKRYFDFSGRSRRKEYWMFVLFVIVCEIITMILDSVLGLGGTATSYSGSTGDGGVSAGFNMSGGYLTMIFVLLIIIPAIAVAVRRMHDQDKSGWWILVPIAGAIMVWFIGGTAGPNRFGPDPKGGSDPAVFS